MLAFVTIVVLLAATSASPCEISGKVTASGLALPGVSVIVSDGSADVATSSTDVGGAYRMALTGPGKYVLKAAMAGFGDASQQVELTAEECSKTLDLTLALQARPAASPTPPPAAAAPSGDAGKPAPSSTSARPSGTPAPAGRFQDLSVSGSAQAQAPASASRSDSAEAAAALPAAQGFQTETASESVTTSGEGVDVADSMGGQRDMLDMAGGSDMMAQRMAMGMDPMGMASMMIGSAGSGLYTMSSGGPGSRDRLQGSVSHTLGTSALDAAPYRLNGRETQKADYTQNRVSATLTGPVKLGRLYNGSGGKTRFTLRYDGSFDHRPYDAYSTVPTAAERAGDLSGRTTTIYDPQTGLAFPGNVIPAARIDPAARALLALIPLPTLPGATQNFRFVTSNRNRRDMVSLNVIHRFGPPPQTAAARAAAARAAAARAAKTPPADGRPATARPAGEQAPADRPAAPRPPGESPTAEKPAGDRPAGDHAAAQGGAPTPRPTPPPAPTPRRPAMLYAYLYNGRYSMDSAGRFPTIGGTYDSSYWSGMASLSWSRGRATHSSRVSLMRSSGDSLNLYAFKRDIAGEAGIGGIATDPIDWGMPNLSFVTLADLYDRNPTSQTDTRWQIGHSVRVMGKKHSLSAGAEWRYQGADSQTDANARGTFNFTGLMTSRPGGGTARDGGDDLADFLLGLPQLTSVQYGPGKVRLRSHAYNAYVTDDWRIRPKLTLTFGLRYEYVSPFVEKGDHLVNLDVTPDFTAAAPVLPGESGPYTGEFPRSLVLPDRDNVAPRVGLAWRPSRGTTVRVGYGVNYNSFGANSYFARFLAAQPPFAVSNTSQGTQAAPLTFASPFVASASTITNSYGIDKHYQLARLQMWNLNLSRDMGHGWTLGASYVGTSGDNLDMQRAPNRDPGGLRIANVQAFLWQSSDGDSSANLMSLRVRKRMWRGSLISVRYDFGKSLDNASSIGGGGWTVAQDDRNLAAERGRSSFDRRHRLFATYTLPLPFGQGRHYLQKGFWAGVAGGWTVSGSAMAESGAPFTARVRGDYADVARGLANASSALRADYTGADIGLADPTLERWFDTDAFVLPPAGLYGNAGRNTITGPGTFLVNMGLTRDVSLGRQRALSIRVQGNNAFNTPVFSSIDTTVNSPTFGQVVGVRQMRTVQILTTVRF